MFEVPFRWLNEFSTRQLQTRRRRKSLLAFGDRLETRTMLSAVVIELVPSTEVMEFANLDATTNNDSATATTGGEIKISDLDAVFIDLATTASTATDATIDIEITEPSIRSAADSTSALPLVPAPTLQVITNPRQAELLTTLYRSLPTPTSPDTPNAAVQTPLPVTRLDVLNDSGKPTRLMELSSKGPQEIRPTAAERVQEASPVTTPANRRSDVINSLFNRLVPEPEPREVQPPNTTTLKGNDPQSDNVPMTITPQTANESSPANPQSTEPVDESPQPFIELKADDAEARAAERQKVTTFVAAGAFLLATPQELWRRARRQLRRMRCRVR